MDAPSSLASRDMQRSLFRLSVLTVTLAPVWVMVHGFRACRRRADVLCTRKLVHVWRVVVQELGSACADRSDTASEVGTV